MVKTFLMRALSLLLLLSLLLSLAACATQKKQEVSPKEEQLSLFIATDPHLYAKELLGEDNREITKESMITDGRVLEHDYALIEALIKETNEKKPSYLILTGDLTYNGEPQSHAALAKILGELKDTKVLLLPGNHDFYTLNCFSAKEDRSTPIEAIDGKEFREIYADCGYEGGYSYDENSLSYIYPLSADQWALMLDTTQAKYNAEKGKNDHSGKVEEATLQWIEKNLQIAKEKGIKVLSFTHHNLLTHNKTMESFTIKNSNALLKLLAKYDVCLNFSGHLHAQNIASKAIEGKKIFDVVNGSLLDYGHRYGALTIFENAYSYESRSLADDALRKYSFQVFCDDYSEKILDQYRKAMGKEKGEAASALLCKINAYYYDGDFAAIHRLMEENSKLIAAIKKKTNNYRNSYVRTLLEVGEQNQHSLIIER